MVDENSAGKLDHHIRDARVEGYGCCGAQIVVGVWLIYEFISSFYRWLRYGRDETVRLSTYFLTPHTSWVGINKIISFVWNLPIVFTLLAALLLFGLGYQASNDKIRELQRKRSNIRVDDVDG